MESNAAVVLPRGTVADWTSPWLTDQASWPAGGELDAAEAEPLPPVDIACIKAFFAAYYDGRQFHQSE